MSLSPHPPIQQIVRQKNKQAKAWAVLTEKQTHPPFPQPQLKSSRQGPCASVQRISSSKGRSLLSMPKSCFPQLLFNLF